MTQIRARIRSGFKRVRTDLVPAHGDRGGGLRRACRAERRRARPLGAGGHRAPGEVPRDRRAADRPSGGGAGEPRDDCSRGPTQCTEIDGRRLRRAARRAAGMRKHDVDELSNCRRPPGRWSPPRPCSASALLVGVALVPPVPRAQGAARGGRPPARRSPASTCWCRTAWAAAIHVDFLLLTLRGVLVIDLRDVRGQHLRRRPDDRVDRHGRPAAATPSPIRRARSTTASPR